MSSSPPPIPPEQQAKSGGAGAAIDDRDPALARAPEGTAGLNLKEQGDAGNREQNVNTVQHKGSRGA